MKYKTESSLSILMVVAYFCMMAIIIVLIVVNNGIEHKVRQEYSLNITNSVALQMQDDIDSLQRKIYDQESVIVRQSLEIQFDNKMLLEALYGSTEDIDRIKGIYNLENKR